MTRVTNFGIKRTYLEAGFPIDETPDKETALVLGGEQSLSAIQVHDPTTSSEGPPTKKKRKRTPKSKRDGNLGKDAAENKGEGRENVSLIKDREEEPVESGTTPATGKSAKRNKRNKERRKKVISDSEARRRKRINEKLTETTCFACREKGHAAKDCPTSQKPTEGGDGEEKASNVVGICYRCGSKRHSLSRCKKPSNSADPYPYASCFVCKGKGHLASGCPQNNSKGVYPNGGSCKLCGDTSHLAKDCGIRQKVADPTAVLGTGGEAGPDEDDFHTLKRRTTEVDRDEKQATKRKQMLELKVGTHSGVVKAFGNVPSATAKKKVVVFR